MNDGDRPVGSVPLFPRCGERPRPVEAMGMLAVEEVHKPPHEPVNRYGQLAGTRTP